MWRSGAELHHRLLERPIVEMKGGPSIEVGTVLHFIICQGHFIIIDQNAMILLNDTHFSKSWIVTMLN